MTVGEGIRNVREAKGLTLKQLGDRIGVSPSYIHAYETGRRKPKLEVIKKIASALEIDPEYLINAEFNYKRAMHMLFLIGETYGAEFFTIPKKEGEEGEEKIAISFEMLNPCLKSWVKQKQIHDKKLKENTTEPTLERRLTKNRQIEAEYRKWMNNFPAEEDPKVVDLLEDYDEFTHSIIILTDDPI